MVFKKKHKQAYSSEEEATAAGMPAVPTPMASLRAEHTEEELLSYGLSKVLEELRALRSIELAIFEVLKDIRESE